MDPANDVLSERTRRLRDRLAGIAREYDALVSLVSSHEHGTEQMRQSLRRLGEMEPHIGPVRDYLHAAEHLQQALRLHRDEKNAAMRELAEEEILRLGQRLKEIEPAILPLVAPTAAEDQRNAIVEIRAGTGGEEAGLFARDLFRMYARYAERRGCAVEVFHTSTSDLGGFREILFLVKGSGAYGMFRFERGTHRVQRIPVTESSGRIHTSAATVAVFPETQEQELTIDPNDLKVDTFCSSGAGGQHVNKTASAVRITHIPSGTVVSCQDERSQLQNRLRAMKILRARLQYVRQNEQKARMDSDRKEQVGTGDRSEKIRTYNFPQNRVTDHRANVTVHALDRIMEGDLDRLLDAVRTREVEL